MANDGIDEAGDADRVEQIADKTGAADHCAGGDGGAGIGEGELEDPDGKERDAGGLIGFGSALQEEPVIADEAVAVAEHEGEANGVEENAAETRIDDALHQHVDGFARSAETRFQHGEADLHAEDEERGDQCPCGVDWVDDVGGFHRSIGRVHLRKEHAGDSGHNQQGQTDSRQFAHQDGGTVPLPLRLPETLSKPR